MDQIKRAFRSSGAIHALNILSGLVFSIYLVLSGWNNNQMIGLWGIFVLTFGIELIVDLGIAGLSAQLKRNDKWSGHNMMFVENSIRICSLGAMIILSNTISETCYLGMQLLIILYLVEIILSIDKEDLAFNIISLVLAIINVGINIWLYLLSHNASMFLYIGATGLFFAIALVHQVKTSNVAYMIRDIKKESTSLNDEKKELERLNQATEKACQELALQKQELKIANKKIRQTGLQDMIQKKILNAAANAATVNMFLQECENIFIKEFQFITDVQFLIKKGSVKTIFPDSKKDDLLNFIIQRKAYLQHECFYSEMKNGNIYYLLNIERGNRTFGYLVIIASNEEPFLCNEKFVEQIIGELAIGLDKSFLVQDLKDAANKDGLTRLYNRRYIENVLESHYITHCNNEQFSVAMFDIDKFKSINDTYGHKIGDAALEKVARIIQEETSKIDGIVGRYGGEEFLAVYIAPADIIRNTLKSILDRIRTEKIRDLQNNDFNITISCGVYFHKNGYDIKKATMLADKALYRAKDQGRDQIVEMEME